MQGELEAQGGGAGRHEAEPSEDPGGEARGRAIADPFTAGRRYEIIYADPPWTYRDQAHAGRRGVSYKYPVMRDREVASLPVGEIAAEDAVLFLWVTWPKLPEALPVLSAWGFEYRTVGFVWVKRNARRRTLFWGMGNWTRANTEPCLLATRGQPKRVSGGVHQVIESPVARHSRKPDVVRERIVALMGNVPRIELFARELFPGWDAWGNEVGAPASPRAAGREAGGPGGSARDSGVR